MLQCVYIYLFACSFVVAMCMISSHSIWFDSMRLDSIRNPTGQSKTHNIECNAYSLSCIVPALSIRLDSFRFSATRFDSFPKKTKNSPKQRALEHSWRTLLGELSLITLAEKSQREKYRREFSKESSPRELSKNNVIPSGGPPAQNVGCGIQKRSSWMIFWWHFCFICRSSTFVPSFVR